MDKYDTLMYAYNNGQWRILDRILMHINSIDTEGKTAKNIKSELYHWLMEQRPDGQ